MNVRFRSLAGPVLLVGALATCDSDPSAPFPGGSCGDGPLMTVPLMALADIDHITPLGNLSPPGHHTFPTGHTYWNVAEPGARRVDVVAPADVIMTRIDRLEFSHTPDPYDYTIRFALCNQVEVTLFHVSGLDGALADVATGPGQCHTESTLGGDVTNCTFSVNRAVPEGELIGYAGDRAYVGGIDVGIWDERVLNEFARPSRAEGLRHTACPLDYYAPAVRAQLESRLGDGLTVRTTPPVCGRFAFDVPGTAQGNWYMVGSGTQAHDHGLALVRDNVVPEAMAISMGLLGSPWDGFVLHFTEAAEGNVRRAFDQVTADGATYCYDELQTSRYFSPEGARSDVIVLLQLGSDGLLRFEVQSAPSCGAGPWAFTGSAVTLER